MRFLRVENKFQRIQIVKSHFIANHYFECGILAWQWYI